MWLIVMLTALSAAWAGDRGSPRSLDECSAAYEVSLASTSAYFYDIVLANAGDGEGSCGREVTDDVTFQLLVQQAGGYSFDLSMYDGPGHLYLTTGCCDGDQLFPRGLVVNRGHILCAQLEAGTYYLTIEGAGDGELEVLACTDPCPASPHEDGFTYEGDQIVYVETVNEESSEPNYDGPFQTDGAPCQEPSANEDGSMVGFGFYNWHNQDFSWAHFFDNTAMDCGDFTIDSAYLVICSYDVDICYEGPAAEASYCQIDEISGDQYLLGILNDDQYSPANLANHQTRLGVPLDALTDGRLDVQIDIDALSDQCAWATTVWSSRLEVYMTCRQIPPSPEGYDLGDLPSLGDDEQPCYPTYTAESGGPANAVFAAEDQVAWLGECVDHELFPDQVNVDLCDDGIVFIPSDNTSDGSWLPFTRVCVEVAISTGPAYIPGTPLFLWAWKDGNTDCDFDDMLVPAEGDDTIVASECVVQGQPFFPTSANTTTNYTVCFTDPGVLGQGRYDGYLRFRLLSAGPDMPGGNGPFVDCTTAQTYVDDNLGETEDYIVADLQLPVELMSFTADGSNGRVVLNWRTASELNNEGFDLQRHEGDGWVSISGLITGAGSTSSSRSYQFLDTDVAVGETYSYRLMSIDMDGNRMVVAEVASEVEPSNAVVSKFALYQNYPNPFNPTTQITYDLAEAANVSLKVFNLLGREVASLVNGAQSAGHYTVDFDATGLPSGMYFYRLETPQFTDMRKMMLLK
ncbi:MAG: T9SS type A sorting domain-containing protein [bacterium]|nr:T9SS type A sorting domain-containing protein [bacterium]